MLMPIHQCLTRSHFAALARSFSRCIKYYKTTTEVSNAHSLPHHCHETLFVCHLSCGILCGRVRRESSVRHRVRQSQGLALQRYVLRRRERPTHKRIHYFWFTAVVSQHQCRQSRWRLELHGVWIVLADNV